MAYGSVLTDVVQSSTSGTPPQFNDGNGTQVGTLCRAWVNFNGTTSPGTIRAAFNVGSVTKNATGDYTLNFTNAMPDANYSVSGSAGDASTGGSLIYSAAYQAAPTTSAFRFAVTTTAGANADRAYVYMSVFR